MTIIEGQTRPTPLTFPVIGLTYCAGPPKPPSISRGPFNDGVNITAKMAVGGVAGRRGIIFFPRDERRWVGGVHLLVLRWWWVGGFVSWCLGGPGRPTSFGWAHQLVLGKAAPTHRPWVSSSAGAGEVVGGWAGQLVVGRLTKTVGVERIVPAAHEVNNCVNVLVVIPTPLPHTCLNYW